MQMRVMGRSRDNGEWSSGSALSRALFACLSIQEGHFFSFLPMIKKRYKIKD
jgi:hypothetical protein